jgi:hypothetical protein
MDNKNEKLEAVREKISAELKKTPEDRQGITLSESERPSPVASSVVAPEYAEATLSNLAPSPELDKKQELMAKLKERGFKGDPEQLIATHTMAGVEKILAAAKSKDPKKAKAAEEILGPDLKDESSENKEKDEKDEKEKGLDEIAAVGALSLSQEENRRNYIPMKIENTAPIGSSQTGAQPNYNNLKAGSIVDSPSPSGSTLAKTVEESALSTMNRLPGMAPA